MSLTEAEKAFLKDLERWQEAHNGEARLLKYPTHPAVQSLADRGYVQLHRALSGPLAIPTGEEMVSLTEAGFAALSEIANFRFEGDFQEGPIEALLEQARSAGIVTEFDTGRGRIVWANGKPSAEFEELKSEVEALVRKGHNP